MNARYLLDGGEPWIALRAYFRSFMQYPPIALTEWRRIGYAVVSLFSNIDSFKQRYLDRKKQKFFNEAGSDNEEKVEDRDDAE
jgi:hypothetical protein